MPIMPEQTKRRGAERLKTSADVRDATVRPPAAWADTPFIRESGLSVAQSNGDAPVLVRVAHAPGDHGISFLQNDLVHGVDASGVSQQTIVFVTLATQGLLTTRIDGRSETFAPAAGTIAVIPQGADCAALGTGGMSAFVMMVPKDTLAFATAERAKPGANIVERLSGRDPILLRLGHALSRHVSEGFVDDPISWYELTDSVVQRLVDAHLSQAPTPARGQLSTQALRRVVDCINANFDRPLCVDQIADAAQQTWSHFPRLFRKSVGLSPHQYVVKVRLRRGVDLLRSSNLSLAEVATRVGFADQSHMHRWIRRMYGATPSQFLRGTA